MKNISTITLKTRRLVLRRFALSDAPAVYRNWGSDPAVTRFLRWNPHENIAESAAIVRSWCGAYDEEEGFLQRAVTQRATGELLGSICAMPTEGGEPEVGYALGRAFWGCGYASEALIAVCSDLFTRGGATRILGQYATENLASGAVLRKAHFLYEHDAVVNSFDHKRQFICHCCSLIPENAEIFPSHHDAADFSDRKDRL